MTTSSKADDELFYVARNQAATTTIVLLHGALSNHLEWDLVAANLSNYHLIIPDLPLHSDSKHIKPFSLQLAADKVASLIRKHAHDGQAHLVGLSLGGFITTEIVRRHPGLVNSAFMSGAAQLRGWRLTAFRYPAVSYYGQLALTNIPGNIFFRTARWLTGIQLSDEWMEATKMNCTYELIDAFMRELRERRDEDVTAAGESDVRMLVVSGGKQDDTEATKEQGQILQALGKGEGKETRAVVVQAAVHAWNMQLPALFAAGIEAWIERKELPQEYEALE